MRGCGWQGFRFLEFRSLKNINPPEKSLREIFGHADVWIDSYLPFYSKTLWVPGFRVSGNEESACDPRFMVSCERGTAVGSAFLITGNHFGLCVPENGDPQRVPSSTTVHTKSLGYRNKKMPSSSLIEGHGHPSTPTCLPTHTHILTSLALDVGVNVWIWVRLGVGECEYRYGCYIHLSLTFIHTHPNHILSLLSGIHLELRRSILPSNTRVPTEGYIPPIPLLFGE